MLPARRHGAARPKLKSRSPRKGGKLSRDRGHVLGGAAAAGSALWPLGARAQGSAKVWRIGIIVEGMRSAAYDGFLQGMDELGYVAGKNYLIEWRFADGRFRGREIEARDAARCRRLDAFAE